MPVSIIGRPEYIVYSYHFNLFSLYTLITIIYSIPPFLITIWMTRFLIENRNKPAMKNGLRPDVFYLFLVMQWTNMSGIFFSILMDRLALSGVYTSFCALDNPQSLILGGQWITQCLAYYRNFATVVFCVFRVFVLFSSRIERKMYFKHLTLLLITLIIVSAIWTTVRWPDLADCVQLQPPYPFGAIEFVMIIRHGTGFYKNFKFAIYILLILILLLSTALTFWKLRQLKLQTIQSSSKKSNFNSEKTLSGTMILILLPLILSEFVIFFNGAGNYLLVVGLLHNLLNDARNHIVTCYFYWTHPIFKRKTANLSRIAILH